MTQILNGKEIAKKRKEKVNEVFLKKEKILNLLENQLNISYILPEEGKDTYIYLHGLYSHKNSSKSKQILGYQNINNGCGTIRFSFRGNGENNTFGFENMTFQTMEEDLLEIFSFFHKKSIKNFVPVASSLGASSLLYFLKKNSSYIQYIKGIILLSPSIEFANDRIKMYEKKADNISLEKRKKQGYLKVFHFANKKEEKISFELFKQSKEEDLLKFIHKLELPIKIFAGRNDDIISFSFLEKEFNGKDNISFFPLNDGHKLSNNIEKIIYNINV